MWSAFKMAAGRGTTSYVILALVAFSCTLSSATYLTSQDKTRLKELFEAARPFQDLASAHYALQGLKLLGVPVTKSEEICELIQSKVDSTNIESIYHAAVASKHLIDCQISVPSAQQTLLAAIKPEATVTDVYYAIFGLKNLGLNVDSLQASKSLSAILKREDNVLSLGYAFYIASQMAGEVNIYFDRIEDVIPQADEVDGKYLQFEGGLTVTAIAIDGAYKLAERLNKAPPITADQAMKFSNYFLSRKHVQMLRGACYLLSVLKTLTENKYHIPVAVSRASNVAISSKSPTVQVEVTNILGASFGQLTVTADSATRVSDDKAVLSRIPFVQSSTDKTLFELNFMQVKPSRGFYRITVTVAPAKPDNRLIGTSGAQIAVKVMTDIVIENVELSVADRDQTTVSKAVQVQYPNKVMKVIEADYHQKILMKFTLKDRSSNEVMTVHQAFVRFRNVQTQQEIIFIAEADSSNMYKFDTDLGEKAKEFDYLSGKYLVELVIGDAVIANPFSWLVAELSLLFQDNPHPKAQEEDRYKPRHEIKHLFREPEKRPSTVVSNTFTGLLFVPVLILLIMWYKIGVNLSNFTFSLGCIGFHLGLAGIYGLYYCFWMYLDMFVTLKYLAVLGIITFLAGNSMLSSLANKRNKTSH